MRAILVALLTLVVCAGGAASLKRPEQIVVWSYVAPERQAHVAEAVRLINRKLPPGAPRVVVRAMPYTYCENLGKRKVGITICPAVAIEGGHSGIVDRAGKRASIRVIEQPTWVFPTGLYCHELSHVITNSYVHGAWTDDSVPCPFDVRAARQRFGQARHR